MRNRRESSRRLARVRKSFAYGLVAAFAFALAIVALVQLPLRDQRIPSVDVPGEDSFFVYSDGDELSHLALFHDLGASVESARKADILFIRNSRMPVGLREDVIVGEAEKRGLRVFSLATGHSEKTGFSLEIIRKHDLRPKVVVAVGGPNFFGEGVSDHAERVMGLSRWEAWKEFVEAQAKWAFQRAVHTWLPKLDWRTGELVSSWIIYRSARTGWWRPVREPSVSHPIRLVRERVDYVDTLPVARELKEELESRAALLVLTMVPYAATRSGHLPYLSAELEIPAVLPSFDELATSDGSHLNAPSGARYAEAFWEEFTALPAVRERLGLPEESRARGREMSPLSERLSAIRTAVVQMRSMLEEYYGGAKLLHETWYLQPEDPRYRAGIGFLADRIARAFVWGDRFVIGTIGSRMAADMAPA